MISTASHGIHQPFGIQKTGESGIFRKLPARIVGGVIKANQFNIFDLLPVIQMKFPEMSNTKYADL